LVLSLSISGAECVSALRLIGFRVLQRSPGGVTLAGLARQIVVVPDVVTLPSDLLEALLDEVDLSHERFLWLLSEAKTLPSLEQLGGS
jgi:hypothetical protein